MRAALGSPEEDAMTRSDDARAEFAGFLRSRRARLRPADVGLPEGARRRVAGL